MSSVLLCIPSFLGCLISLGIAAFVWKRRPGPAWPFVVAFGLAVAWWCTGQYAWLFLEDFGSRKLAAQLQYVGITLAVPFWMLVTLAFTRRRRWLRLWPGALLFVIPVITLAMVATNDWHGLIWKTFQPVPGQAKLVATYGFWFYVHTAYSYGVLTFAIVMLALRFAASPLYRAELFAVVFGSGFVLAGNVIHLTLKSGLPIDPTPTCFSVTFAVFSWIILRRNFLTLIPLARGIALENLRDGVIVLSETGTVVDLNPTARQLLEPKDLQPLGAKLDFLPREFSFPGTDGPGTLRLAANRHIDVRISSIAGETDGPEALVVVLRDVTEEREAQNRLLEAQNELRELNRELERLAHTDALTGLSNRRHFLARLDAEWARAERYDRPFSLMILDLDHFKQVNDTRGHLTGDRVIEAAGRALTALVRPSDVAARYGGEELAVLLTETDLDGASETARRITERFRGLVHRDDAGNDFQVTISIGVATIEPEDATPRDLISRADAALYHAKQSGRDGASRATASGIERLPD